MYNVLLTAIKILWGIEKITSRHALMFLQMVNSPIFKPREVQNIGVLKSFTKRQISRIRWCVAPTPACSIK